MNALRTFEDITPGETHHAGPIEVTREAIVAFARQYDPQPFHLDEAAAAGSLLKGLAASGWHTAAIGMRLYYEAFARHVASMGSRGLDEVRWLRPVRPGDRLSLELTVRDNRESRSRADRGLVTTALVLRNQAGATVMTERCPLLVARHGAVAEAPAGPPPADAPVPPSQPPADPMLTAFFDDVAIGHETTFGTQHFTPELITGFARLYDPQYFHLDAAAARSSHFGGLIASGWQTAAFWMKHYIAARERSTAAREAQGLAAAVGGPSPGFVDLKWLRPVHAGARVTFGMKITGKRRTGRDGWGLISTVNSGHLADGAPAFSFGGRMLWPTGA